MNFTDAKTGDPINTPCTKVDPELFFSTIPEEQAQAKQLCRSCPAMKQCLDFALDHEATHGLGYRHGIWASLGPYERSRLADRRVDRRAVA